MEKLGLENLRCFKVILFKSGKEKTNVPLAIGFGISSKQHVEQVLEHGDIAVIGSKLIKVYNQAKSGSKNSSRNRLS